MLKKVSLAWLRSQEVEAVLWRSTLMFVALDVFFTGLVGAYAFSYGGVLAVLVFIMAQQTLSMLGQMVAQHAMHRYGLAPLKAQRTGVWGLALTLLLAGLVPASTQFVLVGLCLCGGFARGLTYGARLWMEAQLHNAGKRQRYISMVEASGIVFKIAAPAWSLLVLSLTPKFEMIFLSSGLAFCMLLVATRASMDLFSTPQGYKLRPLWAQQAYWRTAPYFIVEGAGHALRTSLFVSGAMSVVGSLKAYALVEVCAALLAACWLFSQSRIALTGPSMNKLKKCLLLLSLAWGCLLGAMWYPWLFPAFVVLYTLSLTLINAQKAGVALGGLASAHGGVESNLMARSILLTVARVSTLGAFAGAYLLGMPAHNLLIAMSLTAIVLLPVEYLTAKQLHRPKAAPLLCTVM